MLGHARLDGESGLASGPRDLDSVTRLVRGRAVGTDERARNERATPPHPRTGSTADRPRPTRHVSLNCPLWPELPRLRSSGLLAAGGRVILHGRGQTAANLVPPMVVLPDQGDDVEGNTV